MALQSNTALLAASDRHELPRCYLLPASESSVVCSPPPQSPGLSERLHSTTLVQNYHALATVHCSLVELHLFCFVAFFSAFLVLLTIHGSLVDDGSMFLEKGREIRWRGETDH